MIKQPSKTDRARIHNATQEMQNISVSLEQAVTSEKWQSAGLLTVEMARELNRVTTLLEAITHHVATNPKDTVRDDIIKTFGGKS